MVLLFGFWHNLINFSFLPVSKSHKNPFALPVADLAHILQHGARDLEALRGKKLFITGGTGFFGKWLVGALCHANVEMGLGLRMTVLSRDPADIQRQFPHLDGVPGLDFVRGNVTHFSPHHRSFDYLLHAAADTTAFTDEARDRERSRAIVGGTRRMLELAKNGGAQRFLYVSSGAVYGVLSSQPTGAKEGDYTLAEPLTTYAEAKRAAEELCGESGLDFVAARAFAFLGPHLPLDAHFAAGNFLRDASRGGPILVRGDGTALRSYLYPTDLVIWLLRILLRGKSAQAYNVGSDEKISTSQLARLIADAVEPEPEVVIQSVQPQGPQNIYLPNVERARTELGLDIAIPLSEAIRRSVEYVKDKSV